MNFYGIPFKRTARCKATGIKDKLETVTNKVIPNMSELLVVSATAVSLFVFSGILFLRMPDGSETPVTFTSRSFIATKRNYSQLDREAATVYWAYRKFYDYIFRRKLYW